MTERARPRKMGIAINAPPPEPGQEFRTPLEDDWNGIRFEVGRAVEYVRQGRTDPLVVDTARYVSMLSRETAEQMGFEVTPENAKLIDLEGLFYWVRNKFCYVDDPTGAEVMQTAARMIRQMETPREILEWIWAPIRDGMAEARGVDQGLLHVPEGKAIGDCEEGVILILTLAASLDIAPIKFRFGGNEGTLHHVWGSAFAGGEWREMDVTQKHLAFDQHLPFDHYDEFEIELTEERFR